ncbi:MAG: tyrosine-type recombinase/integrase [Candidatus Dormibacteria bacterium]
MRSTRLSPEAAVGEYLAHIEVDRDYSPNTVVAYRRDLRRFTDFAAGHGVESLEGIDRDLVRAYQRSLAHLKPSSRARMLTGLRGFFRFLAREGQSGSALALWVDLPRRQESLPKPLEPDDLALLLSGLPADGLPSLRDRALVFFLYSTGARISEALSVEREQLRGRTQRVLIRGKGGRERYVLLTEVAREAVDAYLAARDDTEAALFINFDPCGGDKAAEVLPGQRRPPRAAGRRLTSSGARRILRRVSLELGIPPFSPHQLRHTAGTELLPLSDTRFVQEILGHKDIKTVAVYAKIRDARRDQVYRDFDQVMRRDAGPGQKAEGEP